MISPIKGNNRTSGEADGKEQLGHYMKALKETEATAWHGKPKDWRAIMRNNGTSPQSLKFHYNLWGLFKLFF